MSEERTNQSDKPEKTFSFIFGTVIIFAVFVCLVGMLYCCITFAWTSAKFSDECRAVLLEISSIATPSNSYDVSPDSSSSSSSDSFSVVSSDKNEKIDSLITHMESMVSIQKSGMSNDLMSFVYGILSAVLVGLCATFVVKSRDNAEEAKKQADLAIDKAKATKSAIDEAHNAALIAKRLHYQLEFVIISGRIETAKAELLTLNHISANRTIDGIRKEIYSLFDDKEFKSFYLGSLEEIGKVYDELDDLKQNVDDFLNTCMNKYTDAALESMEKAADNYKKWIQESLDHLEALYNEMRNPAQ